MSEERGHVPARPDEQAQTFDLMRAAIAGLLGSRKSMALHVTRRQLERAIGVTVRIGLRRDGGIDLWLEPPDETKRSGVVYVRYGQPNVPQSELFPADPIPAVVAFRMVAG